MSRVRPTRKVHESMRIHVEPSIHNLAHFQSYRSCTYSSFLEHPLTSLTRRAWFFHKRVVAAWLADSYTCHVHKTFHSSMTMSQVHKSAIHTRPIYWTSQVQSRHILIQSKCSICRTLKSKGHGCMMLTTERRGM